MSVSTDLPRSRPPQLPPAQLLRAALLFRSGPLQVDPDAAPVLAH